MTTSALQTNKVLCIDDNIILQAEYQSMLHEADLAQEFIAISDGKEVLDYCQSLKESKEKFPDVILLDLKMPSMNGWEILDELERSFSRELARTKIIIVSFNDDPVVRKRARDHPLIYDYCTKPISMDFLFTLKSRLTAH